ncbi:MAG TPA: sulfur carrier protein ThiS [Candidatus Cloacimonas sp.]|jgi:thiamine biosynthesis protein ThiS|nr:sulfur carrier protein ThiS [Candidatus Cloacimonas sp.]HRR00239.1 sulfur carrier protein ThiS [Candidatus Cloacimonas sp.]
MCNESVFYVNGQKLPWKEGLVISDALKMMNYTFKMLVVKLNGELVKRENWQTTSIPQNADLKVIHLISGG